MIIPGILETEQDQIIKKINSLQKVTNYFHLDILDNTLFEQTTFLDIQKIINDSTISNNKFEIHFMVNNPQQYLNFYNEKIELIYLQNEIPNLQEHINFYQNLNYQVGISISPNQAINQIKNLNFIQFMTVNPGKQGQTINLQALNNAKEFKLANPHIKIQIDGGINLETIKLTSNIDTRIVGSAILNQDNLQQMYLNFQTLERNLP